MNTILLQSYRYLFAPLARASLPIISMIDSKVKRGILMRKPVNGKKIWLNEQKDTRPIWIHCSSGEFEYAKPLLREIKKRYPGIKTLVTYFSPSYKTAIEKDENVDIAVPTPLETPRDWREFLHYHSPKKLLIARTDLWPEMLAQCREHRVPVSLFSATLSAKSAKLKSPVKNYVYRELLKFVDKIYCVSDADKSSFLSLGAATEKIHVIGDTRYDQANYRLNHSNVITDLKPNRPCITFGSTWREDEKELLPYISKLANSCQLIIAPHEPSLAHISRLEKSVRDMNLSVRLYSNFIPPFKEDVLLIDSVGILAELYKVSTISFVGGSFKSNVHSVMEPLMAGNLVVIGPHHQNNREALDFKSISLESTSEVKLVTHINSGSELSSLVSNILSLEKKFPIKNQIKKVVESKCGATKKLINHELSTLF